MNIEALRQLRRVVSEAPEELFRMSAVTKETTCGTAHCAFGWASVDPWFLANTNIASLTIWLADEFLISFCGASELFGLNNRNTYNLLGAAAARSTDPHAVPRQSVIDNIDRLLSGEDAKPYR
jgi:hypothetical protein